MRLAVNAHLGGVAPVFNHCPALRLHHRILQHHPRRRNWPRLVRSGYVKKNFLRGLEPTEFGAIQAAAGVWLDTIGTTRQRIL
jgi:hypothetical protein